MKTDNLTAELRLLANRTLGDSRAKEMLLDAAAYIEQLETPCPPYAGGEITNAQLEGYLEACEKNWCQVLHVGWDRELARQLLATRRQVEELTLGQAMSSADHDALTTLIFPVSIPAALHHDSRQLVLDTARAMAAKLLKAQVKYGHTNGWKVDPNSNRKQWTREGCLSSLFHHLAKGDPLDCINYLAFMRANGWATQLPIPLGWVPCSPEWIEAGGDCGCAPRVAFGPMGNHYHPAPGTRDWSGETVSVQTAWLACGGNPGIKATAGDLLPALRAMNGAIEILDRSQSKPAPRAMLVGGLQPGKATLLEQARELEQQTAALARRVAGEDLREQVRSDHAAWAAETFGDTGPVGSLKHLSREALEAADAPDDLSEWADMQFLFWDAQRKAGVTDEQITQAMVEKLAVNKARQWPEPKDGEPRFHLKDGAQ